MGRTRPDMCTSMTSTQPKVKIKVTQLLKFRKFHFSRSFSSAVFVWSSKLMVDYDSMGPSLQLVRARFLNFLLSKLSHDFKLLGMSVLEDFQRTIFPYCLKLETHGRLCCTYCVCWYDLDPIHGEGHGQWPSAPSRAFQSSGLILLSRKLQRLFRSM